MWAGSCFTRSCRRDVWRATQCAASTLSCQCGLRRLLPNLSPMTDTGACDQQEGIYMRFAIAGDTRHADYVGCRAVARKMDATTFSLASATHVVHGWQQHTPSQACSNLSGSTESEPLKTVLHSRPLAWIHEFQAFAGLELHGLHQAPTSLAAQYASGHSGRHMKSGSANSECRDWTPDADVSD